MNEAMRNAVTTALHGHAELLKALAEVVDAPAATEVVGVNTLSFGASIEKEALADRDFEIARLKESLARRNGDFQQQLEINQALEAHLKGFRVANESQGATIEHLWDEIRRLREQSPDPAAAAWSAPSAAAFNVQLTAGSAIADGWPYDLPAPLAPDDARPLAGEPPSPAPSAAPLPSSLADGLDAGEPPPPVESSRFLEKEAASGSPLPEAVPVAEEAFSYGGDVYRQGSKQGRVLAAWRDANGSTARIMALTGLDNKSVNDSLSHLRRQGKIPRAQETAEEEAAEEEAMAGEAVAEEAVRESAAHPEPAPEPAPKPAAPQKLAVELHTPGRVLTLSPDYQTVTGPTGTLEVSEKLGRMLSAMADGMLYTEERMQKLAGVAARTWPADMLRQWREPLFSIGVRVIHLKHIGWKLVADGQG